MGNLSTFFVGWYQKNREHENCLGCRDTGKIGIYTQIQVFRKKIGAILQCFFCDWFFFHIDSTIGVLLRRGYRPFCAKHSPPISLPHQLVCVRRCSCHKKNHQRCLCGAQDFLLPLCDVVFIDLYFRLFEVIFFPKKVLYFKKYSKMMISTPNASAPKSFSDGNSKTVGLVDSALSNLSTTPNKLQQPHSSLFILFQFLPHCGGKKTLIERDSPAPSF